MDQEQWERVKEIFHAARERSSAERAAYVEAKCEGEPELRREVESLLSIDDEIGDDFMEDPAAGEALALIGLRSAASWIGRRIGAYQILRELGHGGMGSVFLAARVDAEFDKQVAIKVIRQGLDAGEAIARFRRERQILAGLDHPNIARLLDGGTTEEGLPYLVMEHVEGLPVDRYISSRELSLRQRLELFLKICSAVQLAHRNLVVHRDLKPSNILVTPEGEPKLLDFGIAKLLQPGEGVTQAGLLPMTPEYASPEQVLGESLTTLTDVYSLGVLLCEMLSGRRPYNVTSASPIEIQRVVCTEEPMRPSTVVGQCRKSLPGQPASTLAQWQRQLEGDLDNIVLMALRKEPQRRYSSVEQLAQDVERHLAGLPVLAQGDRWTYRTTKFVQRHRWAVILTASMVTLLLVSLCVVIWQAREARAQRDLAVRAATSMIYELAEGLSRMSGPTEGRLGLLVQAAKILDEAQRAGPSTPKFARLQADSNRVLAQTYRVLGDLSHAKQRAQRAELLARRAVAAHTPTLDDKATLAGILLESGDLHMAMGDSAGADARYDEGLSLFSKIADDKEASDTMRLALALALSRKGDRQFVLGQIDAAGELYAQGLRVEESLMRNGSREPKVAELYMTSLERMGDVEDARGQTLRACQFYREALSRRRAAGQEVASAPITARKMAIALQLAGWCAEQESKRNDAEPLYTEAITIERRLLAADPANVDLKRELSGALGTKGNLYASAGEWGEAIPWYHQAVELTESLREHDPNDHGIIAKAAALEQLLGEALVHLDARAEAETWLTRTAGLYQVLLKAEPQNVESQYGMASTLATEGDLRLRQGSPVAAGTLYTQAEALCRQVIAASRSSEKLELLAEILLQKARADWQLKKASEARGELFASQKILEALKQRGELRSDSAGARKIFPAVQKLLREIPER